jgi:G:T-mismatch repair DNA endonuclease (very short patch repair protein)
MAVGEITTVETECFPDERELEGLPDILKKYRLEEIKEVGRTQLALSSIMKQLTWKIKIVGECQWWLRRTIALLMMRFAVWSTGMKAEISLKDEAVKGD